jgi:hypothetical protein
LDAAPAIATVPAAADVTAPRVTAAAPVMPEAGADGTQMGRVKKTRRKGGRKTDTTNQP